jgi:site-specific DNA recombinase
VPTSTGFGSRSTKINRPARRGQRRHLLLLLLPGRQKHLCDLPYLSVANIEDAPDKHLGIVRLTDEFQAKVRRQLDDALLPEQGHMSALNKRLGARLDELDTKEDGLLDLLDDPEWPRQKITKRLSEIDRERVEIQAQLTDTTSKLEEGQQFFAAALALLANPQGFYQRGSDGVKRAITKVIFSELHVDVEVIAGHDLADGMKGLIEAGTSQVTNNKSDPFPEERAALDRMTRRRPTRRDPFGPRFE